jgi:transposase
LPVSSFFRKKYSWQSVYYYFRKWINDGSWERLWILLLANHKCLLDLSSIQLDGSHTPSKRGGHSVAYQGRKKCKTTNMLFLTDSQGIPLSCSDPIAGNHHDSYELNHHFGQMLLTIEKASIPTNWLFLNADAGFDTNDFREFCFSNDIIDNIDFNKRNGSDRDSLFDELLYKDRFVVERTNAWLDAFKAILIRFETKKETWKALHHIAFMVILLRLL